VAKLEKQFPPSTKIEVVVKSLEGDRISLTLPAKWENRNNTPENESGDVSGWLAGQSSKSFGSLGDAFGKLQL
jgi:hypothetical protein